MVNFNTIDEIINFLLNNSDYNESLSRYFTRYNPIISFINSINNTNEIRWKKITGNLDEKLNKDLEKIRLSIDLKNIILLINIFPALQNNQMVNIESLVSNLNFGGTVPTTIWLELSNNFSFSSLLTKTIITYPKIHDFIIKFRSNSSLPDNELVTFEILSSLSFDNENKTISDIILNTLVFDANIYLLRYILRYEQALENQNTYNRLKVTLRQWKKSQNFIGSILLNYEHFHKKSIPDLLRNVLKICSKYRIESTNEINLITDTPKKENLNKFEDLLFHAQLNYLKREFIKGDQIAKIILVLYQIILEGKNLAWLFFSKSQGFDNEVIRDRIYLR